MDGLKKETLRVCNGGAFGIAFSGGGAPSSLGDVLVYEILPILGIAGQMRGAKILCILPIHLDSVGRNILIASVLISNGEENAGTELPSN